MARDARKVALVFAGGLGLLLTTVTPFVAPRAGNEDFLAYWSAARLLALGGNPYDPHALAEMQQQGCPSQVAELGVIPGPFNPPSLNLVLAPLGLLPYSLASRIWMFLNVLLVGVTAILTMKLFRPVGGAAPDEGRRTLWVMAVSLLFANTMSLIRMGQVSLLVLLGILLAIDALGQRKDFWAGVLLLLATVKPHLSYLVVLIVFLFAWRTRRWRVLAGFGAAVFVTTAIAWLLLPSWATLYAQASRQTPFGAMYTSTLGSFMKEVLGVPGLRYAGVLLVPLAWPLERLASRQGWLIGTSFALLVSVPLAPFGYTFDQTVLLPVIIQLVLWILHEEVPKWARFAVAIGLVGTNLALYQLFSIKRLPYYWFFWVPLALLMFYGGAYLARRAQGSV